MAAEQIIGIPVSNSLTDPLKKKKGERENVSMWGKQ